MKTLVSNETEMMKRFRETVVTHQRYVLEAGKKIGVPIGQLGSHDMSKFELEEFGAYARYFQGGKQNRAEFAKAWLHHIHNNPHHWEYWRFSDPGYAFDNAGIENNCIEMPEEYALEMVADWMGASMAYTGSWDMTNWLMKNASRIKVHPKTNHFLVQKLFDLGYSDLVCVYQIGFGVKNMWE